MKLWKCSEILKIRDLGVLTLRIHHLGETSTRPEAEIMEMYDLERQALGLRRKSWKSWKFLKFFTFLVLMGLSARSDQSFKGAPPPHPTPPRPALAGWAGWRRQAGAGLGWLGETSTRSEAEILRNHHLGETNTRSETQILDIHDSEETSTRSEAKILEIHDLEETSSDANIRWIPGTQPNCQGSGLLTA